MTFSLADVDAKTVPVRGFEGADLASLPRAELLALLKMVSEGSRAWDVAVASVAGEVARRSSADDGPGGLARQQGFASPEQFVASVIGANYGEGAMLVAAGTALSEDRPVAAGLKDGSLSVGKADLIAQAVKPLVGDTSELEARLTRAGRVLDYARLKMMCRTESARFDARQLEGRERRQHEARSLEVTEDVSGVFHLRGQFGTVGGAFLHTYLDAQVKAAFQARRGGPDDDRTATQIRADAFIALAVHGLDCESPATGVKATVITRVNAEDVGKDTGFATCDAVASPISLSAWHQLVIDATILPMAVNGKSEVLDMGREQRLFSWAQRMALAERDGGCAKCHAPVSHCITHHIVWWKNGGKTDRRNGVLLCVRCHTQVHRDRWGIEVGDDNHVWFTPPRDVDPHRRRILGGLAALAIE